MKDVTLVCLYQRHKCWRVFEEKQLKYKTIRLISYLDQWIGWFINLLSIEWFINLCSIDWFNNPWLIDWLINWSSVSSSGKKSSTRTSCPHKSKFGLKRKSFNSVFKFTHQSYMWLYQSLFFLHISVFGDLHDYECWTQMFLMHHQAIICWWFISVILYTNFHWLYSFTSVFYQIIRKCISSDICKCISSDMQMYFIWYASTSDMQQVYFQNLSFTFANTSKIACKNTTYAEAHIFIPLEITVLREGERSLI